MEKDLGWLKSTSSGNPPPPSMFYKSLCSGRTSAPLPVILVLLAILVGLVIYFK
jgi:hypothetical protein